MDSTIRIIHSDDKWIAERNGQRKEFDTWREAVEYAEAIRDYERENCEERRDL